jgi:hypothetical protein
MSITRMLLGAAVIGTIASGGIVLDSVAAPEASAACYGSVTQMKGKNVSCPSTARHWNVIKNHGTEYGLWVGKGSWSQQKLCWANVVSVGMTAK